ncbi:YdeI/OmpD-associated family protein [Aquimarina rhabdastrellae]
MDYLINKDYPLEKFSGKGGWTYVAIPEILPNPDMPFGWVIVSGFIDDYPIAKYKLMPKGDGSLFMAVKAAIRKKIKKQAGDTVRIQLYIDTTPLEIPNELLLCFKNEPAKIYTNFIQLTDGQQKAFIDWIYSTKTEQTKADRIAKMMELLSKNESFSSLTKKSNL